MESIKNNEERFGDDQKGLIASDEQVSKIDNKQSNEQFGGESQEINQDKEQEPKDLTVVVERVKDCKKEGLIGGPLTHVALKSHNSYLIGTEKKGLVVLENGSQEYSLKLPHKFDYLFDTIYYPPLNCYFLVSFTKLYRKDID